MYSAYSDRTGEYFGPVQAVPRDRGGPLFRGGWWMTGSAQVMHAFARLEGGAEPRVFLALMAAMGQRNLIHLTQIEVASRARVSESAASRALAKLERVGIIRRVARGTLQFSPEIAWRGKNKDHHVELLRWVNARQRQRHADAWQAASEADF